MPHRAYTVIVALAFLSLGVLSACGDDSGETAATTGALEATTAPTEAASPSVEEFVPERPLPDDLPIFPGAVLANDIPDAVPNYIYIFGTSGTNREICEFYVSALGDMGLDVSDESGFNDCSYAEEEYYVDARRDGMTVVSVTFGGHADGEGVGYTLAIDHDLWNSG